MELFHVIYSPLQITRPAVKHSFFFCLGWLEQEQIRAYNSEYQLQIWCLMAYIIRKLAFLSSSIFSLFHHFISISPNISYYSVCIFFSLWDSSKQKNGGWVSDWGRICENKRFFLLFLEDDMKEGENERKGKGKWRKRSSFSCMLGTCKSLLEEKGRKYSGKIDALA